MNDDMNFPAIQERLQAEARRLLTAEHGVSASRLADVHRRRQRRRRAKQASVAAAVLLVVLAIRFGSRRAEIVPAPPVSQRQMVAKLEPAARSQQGADVPAVPRRYADAEWPNDGVLAIPFVIGDAAAGEEVITGIYVPEQVEPIDLRDLSPAERDAVRAVLGIEGEDTDLIQPI